MVIVTAARSFMRGRSHRLWKVATSGRKRTLSRRNVLSMDVARVMFIKATKGGGVARQPGICVAWRLAGPKRIVQLWHGHSCGRAWT